MNKKEIIENTLFVSIAFTGLVALGYLVTTGLIAIVLWGLRGIGIETEINVWMLGFVVWTLSLIIKNVIK